ncbi:MAG: hypothetical protein OXP66_19295 [Candidatus Tectomicrobia bacterium]|nr:hypothetical protein [Candidatus Tectomicrobia bacterium]
MKGLRAYFLLLAALVLPGCAALEGLGLSQRSVPAREWTVEDSATVSRRLVKAIVLSYPRDTVFLLSGESTLKAAVEAQLREAGYAIFADPNEATASAAALELTCKAGFVNSADGAGPLWASLAAENWRVDGLFVRESDGRLELSGGLTVRGH